MNNTSNPNVLKVAHAFDELSFDAGSYLCNLAFYMSALLLHGKVGFTGFLHVEPYKDSMYEETGKFIFNKFAHWLQRNFIRVPRHHDKNQVGVPQDLKTLDNPTRNLYEAMVLENDRLNI